MQHREESMNKKICLGITTILFILILSPQHIICGEESDKQLSLSKTPSSAELLPVEDVKTFFPYGDNLIITTDSTDNKSYEIKMINPTTNEILWSQEGGWSVHPSCPGTNASLICVDIPSESEIFSKIYNQESNLIFSLDKHQGLVYSTLNSSFFFTTYSLLKDNNPRFFDHEGNELSSIIPKFNCWEIYPFSDSIIALFETNQITFLKLPMLDTVGFLEIPNDRYLDSFMAFVRTSPSGGGMFVKWDTKLFYVNEKKEIAWNYNTNSSVYHFSFSNDGKYLAIIENNNDSSFLQLCLVETGEKLTRVSFGKTIEVLHDRGQLLYFDNNMEYIYTTYKNVINPDLSLLNNEHLYSSVFLLNNDKNQLTPWLNVNGLIHVMNIHNNISTFLKLNDNHQIIRKDEYEKIYK